MLQARLTEAETAQHKLLTGSKTVRLEQGDRSVTYSETRAADLVAYIASLRAQIARLQGDGRFVRRPLRISF